MHSKEDVKRGKSRRGNSVMTSQTRGIMCQGLGVRKFFHDSRRAWNVTPLPGYFGGEQEFLVFL